MATYNIEIQKIMKLERIEIFPEKEIVVIYLEGGDTPISVPLSDEIMIALKSTLEKNKDIKSVTQG